MAVTLINVFIVPEERHDEFLAHWKRTTKVFRRRVGFIETHLHRNSGVGDGTFSFINVARWTSADAWRHNHDAYQPTEYQVPGVKGHPAIFAPTIDVYAERSSEAGRPDHWIAAHSDQISADG